jgi:hypothetical protein
MRDELEALASARHAAYQAAKEIDFETGLITRAWREANRAYAVAKKALDTPKIAGQRPLAATQPAGQPDTTQWPKVVSISGYRKAA